MTLAVPAMILAETTLSFLGLGSAAAGRQLGRPAAGGAEHARDRRPRRGWSSCPALAVVVAVLALQLRRRRPARRRRPVPAVARRDAGARCSRSRTSRPISSCATASCGRSTASTSDPPRPDAVRGRRERLRQERDRALDPAARRRAGPDRQRPDPAASRAPRAVPTTTSSISLRSSPRAARCGRSAATRSPWCSRSR